MKSICVVPLVSTLKSTSSLSWLNTIAPDDNSTLFELAATSSITSPTTWILLWFSVEELSPISIAEVPSVDKNLAAILKFVCVVKGNQPAELDIVNP